MYQSESRDRVETRPKGMAMRGAKLVVLTLALAIAAIAGEPQNVSVRELPPEDIPVGTCTQSESGFLGVVEKDRTERTKLTDQEIGEYVRKSLAQGYSVALYPQTSGRIFTSATCHSAKP